MNFFLFLIEKNLPAYNPQRTDGRQNNFINLTSQIKKQKGYGYTYFIYNSL